MSAEVPPEKPPRLKKKLTPPEVEKNLARMAEKADAQFKALEKSAQVSEKSDTVLRTPGL